MSIPRIFSGDTMARVIGMQEMVAHRSRAARAAKRAFDVALAALGLLVTTPLVLLLAALIKLESRGPAFFLSPRIGYEQKPFTMLKLRTMAGGQVTRIGRILRPLGLDELPQLWHVLTGRMSMVGPRPEVPERVPRYSSRFPLYRCRHFVRPGITGWAQVSGLRGEPSEIEYQLEHDLHYVREWHLALDAWIVLITPVQLWRDLRRTLGR